MKAYIMENSKVRQDVDFSLLLFPYPYGVK
jgi:hypothetical protein